MKSGIDLRKQERASFDMADMQFHAYIMMGEVRDNL